MVERRADAPLLEVRDLVKHFPLPHTIVDVALRRVPEHIRAVDGVSFTLARGRTLGLVGESGCGKSTLGRCLLRLHEPDRGAVLFDGVDLMKLDEAGLAPYRKRMQVVFQDPYGSLSPRLSISQIIEEGLLIQSPGMSWHERRDKVGAALKEVGLDPECQDRYAHEFSGGQRQRIAIARAMILKPDLVVLDEPTSALDMSVQGQIIELLRDLQARHGLTYLFISHDLKVVRALAHELLVLKGGKVVEQGPADSVFDDPQDPYTRELISASLDLTTRRAATSR